MEKIWNIQEINPQEITRLSEGLNIDPLIAKLLINRQICDLEEADTFLKGHLDGLHDPFLLKGMREAIDRIRQAAANQEKVLIFGDYDVDGVTSSTILTTKLRDIGIDVINHIPHRMIDGYGLNHGIAEKAVQEGVSLLITIDCGITAADAVDTINRAGIEVIIIDHHEPDEGRIPDAYAIINPKQKDCSYPFKELASVGLAAKVSQALLGKVVEEDLDLVAIGTVADIVPLRGENRIFVKNGLPYIHRTNNKGLKALLGTAKINVNKKLSPYHIGFVLGPRINAAGRMDTAHGSLDLFLSENEEEARLLAMELERHNSDRQKMQRDVVQEAIALVEEETLNNHNVIVLSKEGWHKGVLGIVASRLSDKYYRPSVVISLQDGVGTASARSVDGFHLHEALMNCAHCLEEFGGHEGAAGLTIKEENIESFKAMINDVAEKTLSRSQLVKVLSVESEIALPDISLDLANTIAAMEPFGEGNPVPVFCTKGLKVKGISQVLGRNTLKFWVTDGQAVISAVGFGMGDLKAMVDSGQLLDLAYQITIDDWNKAPTPQLKLEDIKISEKK
ncbi:MAG: single-stranded-DNA-specific exonuclease RecJ [Candidatus Omnitrophica bacterium]|nr:single-stranded-DNA-specific exonuclease RecJ [Candidatus Omnitrophota bacterium]